MKAILTKKAEISQSEQMLDGSAFKGNTNKAIMLELLVNDLKDLKFDEILKSKMGNRVVWQVKAQVQTTWGSFDPMFNFIYAITVDAVSGEVVEINQLSGM